MNGNIPAALLAEVDRELAAGRDCAADLTATMREQAAGSGETQALANLALALAIVPQAIKDGILVAILHQLAFGTDLTAL